MRQNLKKFVRQKCGHDVEQEAPAGEQAILYVALVLVGL
mgnify:CR=1 FL=1